MNSFVGNYSCKLDDKGRVLFPAAFKKQWKGSLDRVILKKDIFEDCLVLYPIEEWERQIALLRKKLNPYNKAQNQFLREFYKATAEIELDSSGRMLIPKVFSEAAGLVKELMFIGIGDKVEIWDKDKYLTTNMPHDDFAACAEKFLGGEIDEL
jgi:MraZ protein